MSPSTHPLSQHGGRLQSCFSAALRQQCFQMTLAQAQPCSFSAGLHFHHGNICAAIGCWRGCLAHTPPLITALHRQFGHVCIQEEQAHIKMDAQDMSRALHVSTKRRSEVSVHCFLYA